MDNKYKLHGAFSWCELLTTDVPEAKRFYSSFSAGPWSLRPCQAWSTP
jgi:predicted enzyme related to lactoylglutathione lyase